MNMERIAYKEINGYFIPLLTAPERNCSIGIWGRMRLKYLKEHRPILFSQLLLSGNLQEHLVAVDEQARSREQLLIEQLKRTENITEELKERCQLEWICRVNSIDERVKEIVTSEIVFE